MFCSRVRCGRETASRFLVMRILITGITGFVGGHLAEALLAAGPVELVGVSRHADWPAPWRHLTNRVPLRPCDLTDGPALEALLRDVQPEQVYHLAGYAHVGQSFREPDAAWAGNLTATRCLYDAVTRWGGRPRILYVGSGMIYGDADKAEQAQHEDTPLRPASPYAASKAAADLASYQYTRSPGLDIVRVRPFNHIGPRQSAQFAVASFARQVAAIEHGRQPPVLETGNLTPRRDLTDVRDVVAAYRLLMERGRTGEAYNVGSGTTHAMQDVLDRLRALSRVQIEVRQKAELVRATETKAVRADASRLRRETGWAPRYTLDQTLGDTLAYWRTTEGRDAP
jgi:GDP-4-dehydro-6-deoxy-D-mannose reductase